jgi:hypothetical protein
MKKFLTFALALFSLSAAAQSPMLLSNVRKVFIEKMDNNLDQYLASSISSKFHGSLTVVLDRSSADAILKGANLTAQLADHLISELKKAMQP